LAGEPFAILLDLGLILYKVFFLFPKELNFSFLMYGLFNLKVLSFGYLCVSKLVMMRGDLLGVKR